VLSDPRLNKEQRTILVSQWSVSEQRVMSQSVISQLRVKSIVIECIEMTTTEVFVILPMAVIVRL
jgi:hypothetical protein